MLMHNGNRRLFTTAHAGGFNHFDIVSAKGCPQLAKQTCRTRHVATEPIADPHRELWRLLAIPNNFEVMIEGGHFVHLGHGDVHQLGQGHQVPLVQTSVGVVDFVQMLNEQIAALLEYFAIPRQQCLNLRQRHIIDLPPFELTPLANFECHVFQACKSND